MLRTSNPKQMNFLKSFKTWKQAVKESSAGQAQKMACSSRADLSNRYIMGATYTITNVLVVM